MDINTLRSLATLLLFVAFIALCIRVFSPKLRGSFNEAANLPFAEDKQELENPDHE